MEEERDAEGEANDTEEANEMDQAREIEGRDKRSAVSRFEASPGSIAKADSPYTSASRDPTTSSLSALPFSRQHIARGEL